MIKNFIAYSIKSSDVNRESLEASLSASPFQPCTSYQTTSVGWLPQGVDKFYTRNLDQFVKFSFCIEKRSVPSSVAKHEIQAEVERFFNRVGSKPNKEEMKNIKDDVMSRLLPRAFPKRNVIDVWIDFGRDLLMIATSATGSADEVISFLMNNLRGFESVSLIKTAQEPSQVMKQWILGNAPSGFTIDDQCELVDSSNSNKPTVKFVRHDLTGEKVTSHIVEGKNPVSISMTKNDSISFVLTDKFIIKSIKPDASFGEMLKDEDQEDESALLDAEFLLYAHACGDVSIELTEEFGGYLTH